MDDPLENSGSLTLLKLGGSLITEKTKTRTLRPRVLTRLAEEIAAALEQRPSMQLILGHGAGSFAHVSADRHGTRKGVSTPEQWLGFAEVWWDAAILNHLVMEALLDAGVPAIALSPSASVTAREGQVSRWDLGPLKSALKGGLLPVVHGDVIFDTQLGGTILSTEDLFMHLARHMHPERLLLAGIEPGVWEDYPDRSRIIKEITPEYFEDIAPILGASVATDVTGGMESKVVQCVHLTQELPQLEIMIFSGEERGGLLEVLLGSRQGTLIRKRQDRWNV
jgi:isopentenyl phosphate kinase